MFLCVFVQQKKVDVVIVETSEIVLLLKYHHKPNLCAFGKRVLTDRKRWEEMPDRQISDAGEEGKKESRSQQEKCVSISYSEYVSVRQQQPTRRHSKRKKSLLLPRFSNSSFCDGKESKLLRRNLMSGCYDSCTP